jgi:hypothetical protein
MWLVLLHFQRRSQFDQYGALGRNTWQTAKECAVAPPKARNSTLDPRGLAFSLPDRWQALKAGACRATA